MEDKSEARKALLKLVMLSVCFLVLFTAYNGAQNVATSLLDGDLGYWSVGCVYLSFTFCSLIFSNFLVITLTPKWAMVLGAVLYGAFVVALLKPMTYTLIPLAILLGLGASVIWVGEGSYMTHTALVHAQALGLPREASVGLCSGIFFGIFQLSQVVGNLISSFTLDSSSSGSADSLASSVSSEAGLSPSAFRLFIIYAVFAAVGILGFVLLPKADSKKYVLQSNKDSTTIGQRIGGAIRLLGDPKMALLVPILIFCGLQQGFAFGDLTAKFITVREGVDWVGFVMAVYGACDSLCTLAFGRLCDKIGCRWMCFISVFFFAIILVTIPFLGDYNAFFSGTVMTFIWVGAWGIADAALYGVFSNAVAGKLFPDKSEAAFANLKVWQSGGTAAMFFLGSKMTFNQQIILLGAFLVVGYICVIICDVCVHPLVDRKENENLSPKYPSVQDDEATVALLK